MNSVSAVVVAAMAIVAAGPALAGDGKGVYDKTCVACHASGVAGAPKLGDKAAWGPRVGAGKEAMIATVVKGKGAMPPRAGQPNLSDGEIGDAVDFMLGQLK